MKFAAQYVLSAAVLGGAVWFGIPIVKAYADEGRREPSEAVDERRESSGADEGRREPSAVVQERREPSRVAERRREPSRVAERRSEPSGAPVAAPEYAPGYEPRDPKYSGPRYDWGVLAEEAQAYSEEGRPRVKLPAGTVVERMAEKNSKSGRMFVCRIRNGRRWEEGFLFAAHTVVMFEGPFAFAPKGPSDKVIDYFTKVGQRESRLAALKEAHLRKNPHFSEYQAAAKAYLDFQERAKELTERRDTAVGAERSRLVVELSRMKNEEPRLRAALERAEKPYKEWKARHGDGTESAGDDPEIAALDAAIEALLDDVSEMVPGL